MDETVFKKTVIAKQCEELQTKSVQHISYNLKEYWYKMFYRFLQLYKYLR